MGGNEIKKPLLNKLYYKSCPGCDHDANKELRTGFPIKELLYIWIVGLSVGKQLLYVLISS